MDCYIHQEKLLNIDVDLRTINSYMYPPKYIFKNIRHIISETILNYSRFSFLASHYPRFSIDVIANEKLKWK